MKNGTKIFILAILLLAVLATAVFAYKKLSSNYEPKQDANSTTKTTQLSTAEVPGATEENTATAIPDFTVTDKDGNKVKLSSFFGKPVVVNFWATWCGPCKSELPAFDSAYKEYGDTVTFLMVNLTDGYRETVGGVNDFINKNSYSFPVYFDTGSASNAYNVYSIPTTLFINSDGTINKTYTGSMKESVLTKYINDINGGVK